MIAGTLLVVLTGIFLPGILIEGQDRKSTRLKTIHLKQARMPTAA